MPEKKNVKMRGGLGGGGGGGASNEKSPSPASELDLVSGPPASEL